MRTSDLNTLPRSISGYLQSFAPMMSSPCQRPYKTVTSVRALERHIRTVGGFQHTYCDGFQQRSEFESMFDMALHQKMRVSLGADKAFVDVYTKTRPEMDVFAWLAEEEAQQ